MKILHCMLRVGDLERSLLFFTQCLDLEVTRSFENEAGRFSLVYLSYPTSDFEIELTYNWDQSAYQNGNNFGHIAIHVDNIYEVCRKVIDFGFVINRPPRDGAMAFFKTPDGVSIELLQKGRALNQVEPWKSMENHGTW